MPLRRLTFQFFWEENLGQRGSAYPGAEGTAKAKDDSSLFSSFFLFSVLLFYGLSLPQLNFQPCIITIYCLAFFKISYAFTCLLFNKWTYNFIIWRVVAYPHAKRFSFIFEVSRIQGINKINEIKIHQNVSWVFTLQRALCLTGKKIQRSQIVVGRGMTERLRHKVTLFRLHIPKGWQWNAFQINL